ncbi:PadR family transcriptional regulator [Bacillus thuringiensis]|uniref:PadR family transcriptional regulator n=1 Tax=Bacillus thuringiensis TaxID=1428 RepID=UPI000A3C6FB3|nr:PadR family transcriptional regulator [Bacillus thuringiensis]OUA87635.1 PadR family transcriptional regulator [Bacillus thuringiensis serovar leesis]
MKETQLLKGVLEGCVLSIIKQQQVYGYELVQMMRDYGFTTIVGGTIYPLLQKLEKQELIKSNELASPDGPNRKYFFITHKGEEQLESFEEQWGSLIVKVNRIFKKIESESDEK